jgi:hypothetical protein
VVLLAVDLLSKFFLNIHVQWKGEKVGWDLVTEKENSS